MKGRKNKFKGFDSFYLFIFLSDNREVIVAEAECMNVENVGDEFKEHA